MSESDPAAALGPASSARAWWREHVTGSVDHLAVIGKVHEEAELSSHFLFMTIVSAGIAVLGLLLSSPAVVIGAMLISPLMGPIIGLGFALALFDLADIRGNLRTLAIGIILSVLFCAAIVFLSPLQAVTDEIAARTRPNLFDLLVALFSGLGATYAMIRGRHGAIVGVAIAVAVMPPLATVGFGLATWNLPVMSGAALLFFTNLMTIGISAAILARLYGFGRQLSPRQSWLQATVIIGTLIALAVPLALALRQIAAETVAAREAQLAIAAQFGPDARVNQVDIDHGSEPLRIGALVFTPELKAGAEVAARGRLERVLGRAVDLHLEQFRVGGGSAEATQLAAARAGLAAEARDDRLAERLALVAGVSPDAVMVDRGGRQVLVRAAPLPGATMATYRALEARVAAGEPDRRVVLMPPPAALPPVSFDGDAPDATGAEALATAIWAARRRQLPVSVSGGDAGQVAAVIRALGEGGVAAIADRGGGADDEVTLSWAAPPG